MLSCLFTGRTCAAPAAIRPAAGPQREALQPKLEQVCQGSHCTALLVPTKQISFSVRCQPLSNPEPDAVPHPMLNPIRTSHWSPVKGKCQLRSQCKP